MAIIFLTHEELSRRSYANKADKESVEACVTREVPGGVFIDSTVAPSWLVEPQKRGLGDMTADGLAAIGITKERVSRALGRQCKCPERQAWLNRVGRILGIG